MDHDLATPDDRPAAAPSRRRALTLLGGAGVAAVLAACGTDEEAASTSTTVGSTAGSSAAECSTPTPEETGGPFPADGTNGPDVLDDAANVRSDIRSDQDGSDGQGGRPMTLRMQVLGRRQRMCAPRRRRRLRVALQQGGRVLAVRLADDRW